MAIKNLYKDEGMTIDNHGVPKLSRSYTLNFVGDWGGANFHRICAWLSQEFCDRAGPGSRVATWTLRDGGLDGLEELRVGAAHLAISTPAGLIAQAVAGQGMFEGRAYPQLRALATLPQNDRMVLALAPSYGISTFPEMRQQKPPIRLAMSTEDGTNPIGYVASKFLEAHGLSKADIESWGGKILSAHRPEQCVALVESGEADCLLQEAIMTPWWRNLVETDRLRPLPAEKGALENLQKSVNLGRNDLPARYWTNLEQDLPALDFSDFVILVRSDMPKEVAYMLTWCLVETRHLLEGQYKHLRPERSPLTYPLDPSKMAQTPIPLHEGAQQYYSTADLTSARRALVGSPF